MLHESMLILADPQVLIQALRIVQVIALILGKRVVAAVAKAHVIAMHPPCLLLALIAL